MIEKTITEDLNLDEYMSVNGAAYLVLGRRSLSHDPFKILPMKIATIIYLCVAIFPLFAHANKKLCDELDKMAAKNETINGIFELAKANGYLGSGLLAIIYKGKLLCPVEREVAIKFTSSNHKEEAEIEYKMYTYLNAIDNEDVERYGIPSVYYYDTWNDHILLAITLLDPEFTNRLKMDRIHKLNTIDILIIFKECVRALKYIHSQGVCHNDLKPGNLMFRRNRGFIIDYNIAVALYNEDDKGMIKRDEIGDAKSIWTRFLVTMCKIAGIVVDAIDFIHLIRHPKNYSPELRQRIEKIECDAVRGLLKEMATYAFDNEIKDGNTVFTFYERFYQNVERVMTKLQIPRSALVSWLVEDEMKEAEKLELANIPEISSIKDQFQNVGAKYPEVKPNYFKLKYPQCRT